MEERARRNVSRKMTRLRMAALGAAASLLVIAALLEPSLGGVGVALYGLVGIQMLIILATLVLELVRASATTDEERRLLRLYPTALVALASRAADRDDLAKSVRGLRQLTDRLQQELRARDDAVALAVHELRTPLTSVNAYGQLISKHLSAVQGQVGQLERLISDLLAMPGSRPVATGELDLAREAREAARRLELTTGALVSVEADDGPHRLLGDQGRLGQVLDNLLRNAVKFSPAGSPIDLEVKRLSDEIVVAVTDRGPGIAADELSLIFERYYRGSTARADQPGEGIGLAVSREIVLAHKGRIWATSPGPGRGSTFYVALPASAISSEATAAGLT